MARQRKHNGTVTGALITARLSGLQRAGYNAPKYLLFCRDMLRFGLHVHLYEAKTTVSKYVTLSKGGKQFKVRFSNHKPNKGRELEGNCDFFVGYTHTGVRTTDDAETAALEFFDLDVEEDWNPIDDGDSAWHMT